MALRSEASLGVPAPRNLMAERMIYGVDTNQLHWKKRVINKVNDLWEEFGEEHDAPEHFSYDHLWEFLDAELPSPLQFRECGSPWAYIGIAPYLPFDMPHELAGITTVDETNGFIARALKPFFEDSIHDIKAACREYTEEDL